MHDTTADLPTYQDKQHITWQAVQRENFTEKQTRVVVDGCSCGMERFWVEGCVAAHLQKTEEQSCIRFRLLQY